MDNQIIKTEAAAFKKKAGRPRVLSDIDRKEAIRRSKSKYMLNKEWFCPICNTGRNYTLAGKWGHINTKMHQKNL